MEISHLGGRRDGEVVASTTLRSEGGCVLTRVAVGRTSRATMASFVSVGPIADLPVGKGRCVSVGGQDVALFHVEEGVFAIDNGCPHRGGPLSEGDVSGCIVYCPLHAWSFDLKTGISPGNPRATVGTYPVRVIDGQVEVEVSDSPGVQAGAGPRTADL